jgi:hypothetical protein
MCCPSRRSSSSHNSQSSRGSSDSIPAWTRRTPGWFRYSGCCSDRTDALRAASSGLAWSPYPAGCPAMRPTDLAPHRVRPALVAHPQSANNRTTSRIGLMPGESGAEGGQGVPRTAQGTGAHHAGRSYRSVGWCERSAGYYSAATGTGVFHVLVRPPQPFPLESAFTG